MERTGKSGPGGLLWREALRFSVPPAILAAILVLLGFRLAGAILSLAAVGIALFFRDPVREVTEPVNSILAPADGRVVEAGRMEDPANGSRLAIFMSIFNVHVNRSPVTGEVVARRFRKGRFRPAFSAKAARENQSMEISISTDHGPVLMRQISGAIARRVVCWKRPGDSVKRGERIGLIRFGSRVELILPPTARICVRPGDRVRGGETVIARFISGGAGGGEGENAHR